MIPIHCPYCDDPSNWIIMETPQNTFNRIQIATIREDIEPMQQTNYYAVDCGCKTCGNNFYVDETTAKTVIEEFG